MKENNSSVIISLCSHLCVGEGVSPLEPSEWVDISKKLIAQKKQPEDMLNFADADYKELFAFDSKQVTRIKRLLDRGGSIAFEIERLNNIGIRLITRAESDYPKNLKRRLGQSCPPIFYCCGDLRILNDEFIGVVGSRNIDEKDKKFTEQIVKKAISENFSIVSGGAKGIDSISSQSAIFNGGVAVEFLSDSMIKKIKDSTVIRSIRDERLLLLSSNKPDAGFNVGMAMQRNKYIYAQSMGTVVVKSDFNKGGTWTGAIENLRNKWCHEFCWSNQEYNGNVELIKKGAIPINLDFNPAVAREEKELKNKFEQGSLFELLEDE